MMNLNAGVYIRQAATSPIPPSKRTESIPEAFQRPKEAMRMVEVQYRPRFPQQASQQSARQTIIVREGGSRDGKSPHNQSRSSTKRNLLASPEAKQPNMSLADAHRNSFKAPCNNHMGEATLLYMADASTPSSPAQRSAYSNHSNHPTQQKQGEESSTITRNSSSATSTWSNGPLCTNGDNKRARYYVKSSPSQMICPKCAINLIELNIPIDQLGSEAILTERCKQLDETVENLDSISSKLRHTLDTMCNRRQSIGNLFKEQQNRIHDMYSWLRKTVDESEKIDLARLTQLRNTIIATIENRETQLRPTFQRLDQLKSEVIATRNQANPLTENDYLIKKEGVDKHIKKLEIYLKECQEEGLHPLLPRLREYPLFEGSHLTFLDQPASLPTVDFSFHQRLLAHNSSNPTIPEQQHTLAD